uniref:DNA-directed RNA polymerase n=1 Tax=Nephromyces sp. ex Molgula occidentalis TaxID=2544991 RepID=A0A5C1H7U4_9APIC|nr:plastid-encoded DNA-directed RNA polymerase beta''A [Nephromyces sp. ex Molgula occidentalis]
MIFSSFVNSGINQIKLENNILKYFYFETCLKFIHELMFLGFEYSSKYSFSLNIDSTKSYFYLNSILKNKENLRLIYLWTNSLISKFYFFENSKKSKILFKKFFKLLNNYKQINPISNSLHLMSNTGAKANWFQICQIIGFRGYLSNSQGFLYEIPIMQNFGKGLKTYEFFISCYGARKGIIDTALKTADSGYLTRRLVEIGRDVIIKEDNWYSKSFFYIHKILNINGNLDFLNNLYFNEKYFYFYLIKSTLFNQFILYKKFFNKKILKDFFKLKLFLKTISNCNSGRTFWNKCFGLKNVLGNSVGILVGQSIGERGTQLTLRTFHTGGVFIDIKNNININYNTLICKKYLLKFNIFKKDKINFKKINFYNSGLLKFKIIKNNKYNYFFNHRNFNNFISNLKLKLNIYNNNFLNTIYKSYQIIPTIKFKSFNFEHKVSFKYYMINKDINQILTNKIIYLLFKNSSKNWILKNINTNIYYNKKLNYCNIYKKQNLVLNNLNNYFKFLQIYKNFISKISFLNLKINNNYFIFKFKIR